MKRYPGLFSFLLFLSACVSRNAPEGKPDPARQQANVARISELQGVLRTGDMIFRNGNDEVSRAARSFNRKDTSYSHCGLVLVEHDSVFVYHALGGVYNPSQKLLREPLALFCNPEENNTVAAYRYPLNAAQLGRLENTVKGYYAAGLKFDLYFNFLSDDRMYCAEFVFKSLNKAVGNALSSYVRMDTIPYGVTTDDLFLHPDSRLLKKEKFVD
ncbi:MAG: YiiX/YebB-like N1pC/P60 family cysteine hydrolase [Chitinophagaceae bacterium]